MVKWVGGNEEAVEQAIEEIENRGVSMTLGTIIQNYLVGLIFPGFILALIVSAIVKKNPPEGAAVFPEVRFEVAVESTAFIARVELSVDGRYTGAGRKGRHLLTAFGPGFSAYFVVLDL